MKINITKRENGHIHKPQIGSKVSFLPEMTVYSQDVTGFIELRYVYPHLRVRTRCRKLVNRLLCSICFAVLSEALKYFLFVGSLN